MKVRISAVLRTISDAAVRIDGTKRAVSRVGYYNGTSVVNIATFASPLSATVSPDTASGDVLGGGQATTNSLTITPEGGTGPFSYAWARLSGDGAATQPTRATTAFTHFFNTPDGDTTGTFRCTVTDSLGETVQVTVVANFSSINNL